MKIKFIRKTIDLIYEKRLTTVAGAWVYYFLISLIPLCFLLVTAFSVFKVDITHDLIMRLPLEFRDAGLIIISTAENASNVATVFFVLTVIFSCTTLLNQMSKDGDFIYGERSKTKRGIMRRVFALFALTLLFFIFLGIAIIFAFGYNLKLNDWSTKAGSLVFTFFIFSIAILFGYVIILILNAFICPQKISINNYLFGSFISLVIMVLGTIGFMLYLRFFAKYNIFYGSLASIIVFLLWAYILMLGLVIGVILNMKIYQKSIWCMKEKENAKN